MSERGDIWTVRREDGVIFRFTTAALARATRPRKFQVGSQQYKLAWQISHNLQQYEKIKTWGHHVVDLHRQDILTRLEELVAVVTQTADRRSVSS